MGAPRKYYRHKSVLFVTFSLERGLLLLSNPLCQMILKSCLARAQFLYPVKVCHFVVHSNHIHLILVVINPVHTTKFIGHFKAEVAHRLNIIMSWTKRTVWCEGYDSPVVLTPIRALMAISYLYANPARDNQEDSIDLFPGLTSWKMFRRGEQQKSWRFIRRPAFKALPSEAHCLPGYTRAAEHIASESKKNHTFILTPNAWLEAFGVTKPEEQAIWNEKLVKRVRLFEERARQKRAQEGKRVVGKQNLLRQNLTLDYQSKRSGKRMWCLSEKRSVRVAFINFLKRLLREAREVYQRWHVGDYSVAYPLGLFSPSQPKLAEVWIGA